MTDEIDYGILKEDYDAKRAEIERLCAERDERTTEVARLLIENERLREEIATCRELRQYDRKEIEHLRTELTNMQAQSRRITGR